MVAVAPSELWPSSWSWPEWSSPAESSLYCEPNSGQPPAPDVGKVHALAESHQMIDDSCFPQDFAGVLLIRGLARYFDDAREHAFSQLFIFNPVLFHVVVLVVVGRGRREVVLVSIQGPRRRGAAHRLRFNRLRPIVFRPGLAAATCGR